MGIARRPGRPDLPHVFILEAFSNDECVSLDEGVATQPQPSRSELTSVGAVELASALSRKCPVLIQLCHPQNSSPQTHIIPKYRLLQYRRDASNSAGYQFPTALLTHYIPSLTGALASMDAFVSHTQKAAFEQVLGSRSVEEYGLRASGGVEARVSR